MAVVRKIKDKIKKIASMKKVLAPVKKTNQAQIKDEMPGASQVMVERTKFSQPDVSMGYRAMPHELPYQYERDRIVLQVRDVRWLHAYWELKTETVNNLKYNFGDDFYRARRVLRVYDVTSIIFNGSNANSFFDIHINEYANNWYIDTNGPGRSWCVDLGLILPDGRFVTIIRSNIVQTPLDGPSWITDEEWMIPDDMFNRLYGLGFGTSSPVGGVWGQRTLASGGIASMASPVRKEAGKPFWMLVNCELIVYGATEPDAKVTVQGKEITLRPDGTFTLRFALPDGKQVIPVKAVSADKRDERSATPIVTRETK
jgi:hypothetical protein